MCIRDSLDEAQGSGFFGVVALAGIGAGSGIHCLPDVYGYDGYFIQKFFVLDAHHAMRRGYNAGGILLQGGTPFLLRRCV